MMPVAPRVLYAMPDQSGGSPPSSSPRNGGTSQAAETLIDVDHRHIFPQEWPSDRYYSRLGPVDRPLAPPRHGAPGCDRRLTPRTALTRCRHLLDCGSGAGAPRSRRAPRGVVIE